MGIPVVLVWHGRVNDLEFPAQRWPTWVTQTNQWHAHPTVWASHPKAMSICRLRQCHLQAWQHVWQKSSFSGNITFWDYITQLLICDLACITSFTNVSERGCAVLKMNLMPWLVMTQADEVSQDYWPEKGGWAPDKYGLLHRNEMSRTQQKSWIPIHVQNMHQNIFSSVSSRSWRALPPKSLTN